MTKKMNNVINNNNKIYSILFIIIFLGIEINVFISYFMKFLGIEITFLGMNLITSLVYAIVYISSFIVYFKSIRNKKDICIFMLILLIYIVEYLIFENNRKYFFTTIFDFAYNPFYILFGQGIPLFFIIINIKNYDYIFHLMKYISIIAICLGSFIFFFISAKGAKIEYMTYAYSLLIPACFSFYYLLREKKFIYLFSFIIASITMLIIGCRGALMCFALYTIIRLIYDILNNFNAWKLLGCIIFVVSAFFCILFFNEFILLLNNALQSIGIYSRTLTAIIEKDFFVSNSRGEIIEVLLNNLKINPLIGFGLYGDRYLNYLYSFNESGAYAHNLFLEILTQFGILVGGLILISLMVLLIRKTFQLLKQKGSSFDFFLIFVICYLTKSMVTGSYLSEQMFWIFLGLLMVQDKEKK